MPDDKLYHAVLNLLGRRPTPAARRRVAQQLRELADQQEHLAGIQAEQQARPAGDRLTPRQRTAGPGRPPANFVRVERRESHGRERLRVHIGRALWYALGSPPRIQIQRLGGELRIDRGDEYTVIAGGAMPRVTCDGSRDLLADIDDGRYATELRGQTIVVRV